jgi:hypothetical protein
VVTYAVVDARTGGLISSHPSFDAARAELPRTGSADASPVAIYVFDDTGHVSGECLCGDCD